MTLFTRRHARLNSTCTKKFKKSSSRKNCAVQFETLETRLALTWAGVPPLSVTPTVPVAVTLNSQSDATGTATIATTEVDYYAFTATVGGAYSIAATTPSSNVDTVIGIFNSAGQRIAYNDDAGGSTDSRVTVNLTAGTKYYLGVTNYVASSRGAYTWSIDGPSAAPTTPPIVDDAYEQNDTRAAAYNLGTLTAERTISNLALADSDDWFRFDTTAMGSSASVVQISYAQASGDVDLELYNSAGTLLGRSQNTTGSEALSLNGLAAGTYYARVYGYRGALNPSYSLTIKPGATPTPDLMGASLLVANASTWGGSVVVNSVVENSGTGASGAFNVQWYLSTDATGSSNDILLNQTNGASSYAVNGLGAHAVVPLSNVSLQLPASAPSGFVGQTFIIIMKIDSGNAVAESNENNNFGQVGNQHDKDAVTITASTPPPAPPTGGFQIALSMSGLSVSQQAIFQQAAARWSQVIVGDLPNATYQGTAIDDLLIGASAVPIDGVNGILGQAGPDAFRTGSLLPYHGIMQFDTADLASMESSGLLYSVILHEMGHVLGFGTIWTSKGLVSGSGTSLPLFTGAQATAAYNATFGVNSTGVPLETTGGPGTAEGHWSDSLFGSELMTGFAGPGVNLPLSSITVAQFADLGYSVNMAAADPYTPPAASRTTAATLASRTTTSRTSRARLTVDDVDLAAVYQAVAAENASSLALSLPQVMNLAVQGSSFDRPLAAAVDRVIDTTQSSDTVSSLLDPNDLFGSDSRDDRWTSSVADHFATVSNSWEGVVRDHLLTAI